jgi:hypothetical protein
VRRTANPASLITLGLVNPETKGKKTVAKRRRHSSKRASATAKHRNPRRRRHARKNGTRIYVVKRNSRRRSGGRRNPEVFGLRGSAAGKAIIAGLVGVYATKTVGPMIANVVPSVSGSPIISALISAAVAYGGGLVLQRWDKTAAEGFMFGGLMQAGSQALSLVVPSNPLSLNGLGDFTPARFAIPQNPILAGQQALPPIAASSLNGMGAALSFK